MLSHFVFTLYKMGHSTTQTLPHCGPSRAPVQTDSSGDKTLVYVVNSTFRTGSSYARGAPPRSMSPTIKPLPSSLCGSKRRRHRQEPRAPRATPRRASQDAGLKDLELSMIISGPSGRNHPYSLQTQNKHTTQFEIECRSGGHSVTKKFSVVLQFLVSKLKL